MNCASSGLHQGAVLGPPIGPLSSMAKGRPRAGAEEPVHLPCSAAPVSGAGPELFWSSFGHRLLNPQ